MFIKEFINKFSSIFNDIKPFFIVFNLIKLVIFSVISIIISCYGILIAVFLFGYAHQFLQFLSSGDFDVFDTHVTHDNYMHNFSMLGFSVYVYFIMNGIIKVMMHIATKIF
jgi:hypothetical protein